MQEDLRALRLSSTCRFLFLVGTRMPESSADDRTPSQHHPLPTYLGGEKQRTCENGLIWTLPTGLGRTLKVRRGVFASTSILWWLRTLHMSILVALVAFSYEIASADHLPPLPVEENFDCETDEESYFEPLESSSTYLPTSASSGTS